MDVTLKRRAVYTGLRPFLSDDALEKTLQLWQDEYSQNASYAFTEFLTVCCNTPVLKKKRARILTSLLRAMEVADDGLLPDPLQTETGQIKVSPSEPLMGSVSGITTVFVKLFDNLLAQCDETKAAKVRLNVLNQVRSSNLNPSQKEDVSEWLNEPETPLAGEWENSHLRHVINYGYVALCEHCGPVKADQVLAQAVNKTEPYAHDKKVNLHDLL